MGFPLIGESPASNPQAMSGGDSYSVPTHGGAERAALEAGDLPVGGQGGPGGPLSHLAVEAFTDHGSRAQRMLLGRGGANSAFAIAGLAATLLLINLGADMATYVTASAAFGAFCVGLILYLRPGTVPMWAMDGGQLAAVAGLVGISHV